MTTALACITIDGWRNRVLCMDALTMLRSLPAESVHCMVTSPPYYGLRNYDADGQIGLEDTPDAYVARLVAVFAEARRVLRGDGVLWLNLGDSYAANRTRQVTPTKWPALEQGQSSQVPPGLKPKDLIGIPWRVALALQADGWWLRSDIIWHKPNPMPESVTDRCTVAHEYVFMLTKAAKYWYDADAVREGSVDPPGKSRGGSLARVGDDKFVAANAHRGPEPVSTGYRNRRTVWTIPTEPRPFQHYAMFPQALIEPMILAGCPDTVCSACGAGYVRVVKRKAHGSYNGIPTDKGTAMRNDSEKWAGRVGEVISTTLGFTPSCDCNAPTSPGIVLDPFMGSGTTAIVAQRLGRDFVGCDLNPDYVALATQRVRYRGDDRRMVQEHEAGVKQLTLL